LSAWSLQAHAEKPVNINVEFRPYTVSDQNVCLRLFDANCPDYFAPNERGDYQEFLASCPAGYELCLHAGRVVGAFGLFDRDKESMSLNWILLDPDSQGLGLGSMIMEKVSTEAVLSGTRVVHIAASHRSAPFFAKFGAIETAVVDHGWGIGMHRIDMELHH
jgi:GNAT superfamily N-acetyltransferase